MQKSLIVLYITFFISILILFQIHRGILSISIIKNHKHTLKFAQTCTFEFTKVEFHIITKIMISKPTVTVVLTERHTQTNGKL